MGSEMCIRDSTDTSEAELAFQADLHGVSMITSLFPASSAAGNNTYRIHHCSESEEPHASNCIIYARSTATSSLPNATHNVKIILNPGDRIFCQLHSGDGITITAYGLRPLQPTTTEMSDGQYREQSVADRRELTAISGSLSATQNNPSRHHRVSKGY